MSLYHVVDATETVIASFHGVVKEAAWSMPLQTEATPGVIGVGHLVDEIKDRELSVTVWVYGYVSPALFYEGMEFIDGKQGEDITLRWKEGSVTQHDWENCTFLGFNRDRSPTYDPEHGWNISGVLNYIQREPNA